VERDVNVVELFKGFNNVRESLAYTQGETETNRDMKRKKQNIS
jgi:hypothetical protein